MKKILLVEDDKSLRETLTERLAKEGYDVQSTHLKSKAIELFDQVIFDAVVLDVGLPDGSGHDIARYIRDKSKIPFLFMTALSAPEDRLKGYELGAEEYLPKPFHLKEFLIRIKHVVENHSRLPIKLFQGVQIDFNAMTYTDESKNITKLNKKESDVLQLLVEKSPQVISRDEILNKVWGEDEFPTNRTVDNIILRLRQILGPEKADVIKAVRGIGYQWVEAE